MTGMLDGAFVRSANQRRIEFLQDLGHGGAHQYSVAGVSISTAIDVVAMTAAVTRALGPSCEMVVVRGVPSDVIYSAAFAAAQRPSTPLWHTLLVIDDEPAARSVLAVLGHALVGGLSACETAIDRILTCYDGLHPETSTFTDEFALREAKWLTTVDGIAAVAAWSAALVGAPAALQLPHDRRRPLKPSYRTATVELALRSNTALALKAFLATHAEVDCTEVMIASWAGIWARYANQDDIVVGVPIRRPAREDLLRGHFDDTLPVRVDASDDPNLATLLERTRRALRDCRQWSMVPFAVIADTTQTERDTSRHPIFQVCVSDESQWQPVSTSLGAVKFACTVGASEYDLAISYAENDGDVVLRARYSTDLFDEATVADMLSNHQPVLAAMVSDVDITLSSVALLDEAQHRSARRSGAGRNDPTAPTCLQDVFDAVAQRFPDAAAVSGGGRSLTYLQLNQRANRLAQALLAHGVRRGDVVAIAARRDPDLLTAIVAIHRCSAAYLPLEPSYPDDRLAYMVDDGGVAVLVASPEFVSLVPSFAGAVIAIDEDQLAEFSATEPLLVEHDANDLAYVIYTSGSTGRPKGVMVAHHGVVNLMREMAQRPGLQAGETMVGVTTPAFDLSVPDLFLPMTVGGHLVLCDPASTADPQALGRLLEATDARLMQATPATWRMLIDSGWAGRRQMNVVCGGESYTSALAVPLSDRVATLWNFYGPTEATVWCTSARLAQPTDPLPLGDALPNMAVFVGDFNGIPVPVGVPGELLIAGLGLARGYLGRGELTAERFIDIDDELFPRAYRTGDLVRRRRDGSLEFMGRIDHQVKLRGFRIELGEIEQTIAALPGVGEVVVVVRQDDPSDPQIVGYVVGKCDPSELRRSLGKRLPAYMVPTHIIVLDDLPRTPNGKTDRLALPAPPRDAVSTASYVAPRGPVEEAVAAIWIEVLAVGRVGVFDDFFELGGHSLRLTQVLTRVSQTFDVELRLSDVYAQPTVAATSEFVVLAMLEDPNLAALLEDLVGPDTHENS